MIKTTFESKPAAWSRFTNLASLACLATALVSLASAEALAAGRLSVVPFASVSSTKAIKPAAAGKKDGGASKNSTETVTQRTAYGMRIDIRLSRLFALNVSGGVNAVDQTKKSVAVRDEYGDIDFQKDANVDPANQEAEIRYKEQQRLGVAKLVLQPMLTSWLTIKASAGVRARQRLIDVEDKTKAASTHIKDPIRYNAVAGAGVSARLLKAFTAHAEYNFYFLKFPKTQPHEQEALIGFGVSI